MIQQRPLTDWLPITQKEVEDRGWSELDVIIVPGDAYVDPPCLWCGSDWPDY